MKLMTEAEVKIQIRNDREGKILQFDKPVCQIGLSEEESARLASSLLRGIREGITAEIRILIDDGFFKKERKFAEIKKELKKRGLNVKSDSLAAVLSKMSGRKELKRFGHRRQYKYTQFI